MHISRKAILILFVVLACQSCQPDSAADSEETAKSYLDLSQSLISRGSVAAAAEVAQRAANEAATSETRSTAYVTLSRAKAAGGDLPAALEAASRAVSTAETGIALRQRGYIYGMQRQFEKARADFEKALALNPGDPESKAELAKLIVSRQPNRAQLQRAHELLSAAIAELPENPTYYEYRGLVNDQLVQLPDARADYDAAIARGATLSLTYFRRGILRLRDGDVGGCEDLDAAIARGGQVAANAEALPMTRVCVGRLRRAGQTGTI